MSDKLVSLDDLQTFADGLAPYLGNVYVDNSTDTYKTAEMVIGQWIDGKPLYQKTVFLEENHSTSFEWSNTGIPSGTGILFVTDSSFLHESSGICYPCNYSYPDDTKSLSAVVKSNGNILIDIGSYYNSNGVVFDKFVITVRYTKTVDTVLPTGNYEGIIKREIVTSLPQTGLTNCVYFLLTNQSSATNKYEEWMYINGEWEHLGVGDGISKLPVIHTNVTAPITGSTTVTPG